MEKYNFPDLQKVLEESTTLEEAWNSYISSFAE